MPRQNLRLVARAGQGFQVIELEDSTLTLLRTALVPKLAQNPDLAAGFVAYLLSPEGQTLIAGAAGLPAIEAEAFVAKPHLSPIRLDPGLLAQLDQLTRQRFFRGMARRDGSALGQQIQGLRAGQHFRAQQHIQPFF